MEGDSLPPPPKCSHESPYGVEPGAQRRHATDRGERRLGGAGGDEQVGGPERGDDELVEGNALRLGEPYAALDLSDRPAPERRDEVLADPVPTFRSGGVIDACIGTPAGGAPMRPLARSLRRSLGRGLGRAG